MNTRILTSMLTIVAVVAAVGATTYALFSDSQTSSGNTFTAGSLDLALTDASENGTDDETATWIFGNIAPGGSGGATLTVNNNGTLPGNLDVSSVDVGNFENTCLGPETAAGDVSCTGADGDGELGANLLVHVFWDTNNNGVFDGSDDNIYGTSGTPLSLNGFEAVLYDEDFAIVAGDTTRIRINWSLPSGTGNDVMSDSSPLSFTVELDQSPGD